MCNFGKSIVCVNTQEEMTNALSTMRVDYEQIKIKAIEDSSNPLLLKRRKKMAAAMKEAPGLNQTSLAVKLPSSWSWTLRGHFKKC